MRARWLVLLVGVLLGSVGVEAATVYLDQVPGGNCINTYNFAGRSCGAASGVTSYSLADTAKGAISGGDTISVRGGTHVISGRTYLDTAAGSAGNWTKLWATPGETPILDGATMTDPDVGLFEVTANYWHIKGLEIKNASRFAIKVLGANVIIENNNLHHCVRLSDQGGALLIDVGATNALILNNDSHHNSYNRVTGSGGDGFESHAMSTTGIVFRGNRAWRNHDDGFDFSYSKAQVTIDQNWSWQNGYDDSHNPQAGGANGAGYKMGLDPSGGDGGHLVRQNLAWDNSESGFDCNTATVPTTYLNNTAWNNAVSGSANFSVYCQSGGNDILTNNISLAPGGVFLAGDTANICRSNSWNRAAGPDNCTSQPHAASTADFASIDFSAFPTARQADGSLPVTTFLHLASGSNLRDVGTNVGLPGMDSTPDLGAFQFAAAADPCDPVPVVMTGVGIDTGFAWATPESANRFGTPADASATPSQSTLRLFENSTELVPHQAHSDIRTLGQGRFSHWSGDAQATQYLIWSATDNSNVTTNGRTYTYVIACPAIRSLYHLDESASPAVDSIGGRNGTWQNTPTPVASPRNGALQFDSSQQEYVSATSPNITEMATVAAWVRINSLAVDYQTILANYDASAVGAQFDLSITGAGASQGSGAFFYGYRGATTRQFFSAAGLLTTGTWYHLLATDDGADNIKLYLNGTLVTNTPAFTATAKPTSAPGALGIGRAGAYPTAQYFNGTVDEVHIRDSVMTPAEIAALAAEGATTVAPAAPTNLRVVAP